MIRGEEIWICAEKIHGNMYRCGLIGIGVKCVGKGGVKGKKIVEKEGREGGGKRGYKGYAVKIYFHSRYLNYFTFPFFYSQTPHPNFFYFFPHRFSINREIKYAILLFSPWNGPKYRIHAIILKKNKFFRKWAAEIVDVGGFFCVCGERKESRGDGKKKN